MTIRKPEEIMNIPDAVCVFCKNPLFPGNSYNIINFMDLNGDLFQKFPRKDELYFAVDFDKLDEAIKLFKKLKKLHNLSKQITTIHLKTTDSESTVSKKVRKALTKKAKQ